MNWRKHIEIDPAVMGGKPVLRGTRITVEIILDWLAAGWSEADVRENYPGMSGEALKAVFAFARERVSEQFYALAPKAA